MPPRKKAKIAEGDAEVVALKVDAVKETASRRKSNKVVKPAFIDQIPLEVFEEIAKDLTPGDLLNLARSSKYWRTVLMTKNSRRIWEASRERYRVPDCPVDLSEPRFADLLFGKGCSLCPATRTSKDLLFEFRVRLCSSCIASHVVPTNSLAKMCPSSSTNLYTLLSMIPTAYLNQGRRRSMFVFKSQYEHVSQKMQAFRQGSDEQAAYIADRSEVARAVMKSATEMKSWFAESLREKRREEIELLETRRASIIDKLKALGYGDEDLDDRYDNKEWKWRAFFDKASPLTDRGWKTLKPQLVETIKLRREHTSAKFHDLRRLERQEEMKTRFKQFGSQLENFPRHKLFLPADLLELPVVKELVEENDCRIPVTDERWLTVEGTLVEAARAHAAKIEDDCHEIMDEAKYYGFELAKDLYWEKDRAEWERGSAERREDRRLEREMAKARKGSEGEEEDEDDESSDDESVYDEYPEEPPDDLVYLEEEYTDDYDRGLPEDFIPTRLLSADSLFQRDTDSSKKIVSYSGILRKRASRQIVPGLRSEEPVAWCKEKYSSSGEIVNIARMLLKHLRLPVRTKMAYMEGCRDAFVCRRCSSRRGFKWLTWAELVEHFVAEYRDYEDLCGRNFEKNLDVPLRNDHSLDVDEFRPWGFGLAASMRKGLANVAGGPLTENGNRYTEIAEHWGFELPPGITNFLNADHDQPVGIPWGDLDSDYDSSEELLYKMAYEGCTYDDLFPEKCKLCAKLGRSHAERTRLRLEYHMERKHGVDRDGNLLVAKANSANK